MASQFRSSVVRVASWGYDRHVPGGAGVSVTMERSGRLGHREGRAADRDWGLDSRLAGALAAPIGPASGRGHGPVRSRYLRSRQVAGGGTGRTPTPPTGRAVPWWKSKWWHIAVLALSVLIFITCIAILIGVKHLL